MKSMTKKWINKMCTITLQEIWHFPALKSMTKKRFNKMSNITLQEIWHFPSQQEMPAYDVCGILDRANALILN